MTDEQIITLVQEHFTDDDLMNKVPENKLGIYSIYCDKSQWGMVNGIKNFWNAINEGYIDMTYEFFETL